MTEEETVYRIPPNVHLTPPLCDVCGISLLYHSEEDLTSCGISTEEE